jgi:integrase
MAKRRGNNEGSVTQLPSGLWQARISYVDRGVRKRIAFYGKTRKEAVEKMQQALAELQKGMPVVSERTTVAEYLQMWLDEIAKPTLRPRTFQRYEQLVRVHLIPHLGHLRLTQLAPAHVNKMMQAVMASGLTAATAQRAHAVLRRALGQAEKWGMVARNVAKLVDTPKVERKEVQPLTAEQIAAFLEQARGHRLYALFLLAVSLGLRQGELLGLRWQDIDFEKRLLRVRVQLQRVKGQYVLSEPKSTSSKRTLQLPDFVLQPLQQHRANQLLERAQVDVWGNTWDLVFTTSSGRPIDARDLTRAYSSLLRRAGIPYVRFHTLRHTAASWLLAMGCDIRMVQAVLGHSQISLTANLYTHVVPALLKEAAERMESFYRGLLGD